MSCFEGVSIEVSLKIPFIMLQNIGFGIYFVIWWYLDLAKYFFADGDHFFFFKIS